MSWLRLWLEQRRLINQQRAYEAGFDWAAGELLRGRDPESVEAECDRFPPRDFDLGARGALSISANIKLSHTRTAATQTRALGNEPVSVTSVSDKEILLALRKAIDEALREDKASTVSGNG